VYAKLARIVGWTRRPGEATGMAALLAAASPGMVTGIV